MDTGSEICTAKHTVERLVARSASVVSCMVMRCDVEMEMEMVQCIKMLMRWQNLD